MIADGIVPAALLRQSAQRLPGEVFAAELLTAPLVLRKDGGQITVCVDRSGVEYMVISTAAKAKLCELYVKSRRRELIELDRAILAFMRGSSSRNPSPIQTRDLPLRWASGGVLSVVTWRGAQWIPFFFRDIPPYGWNIALGGSERAFDDNDVADATALEDELQSPSQLLLREFLEETLALERAPHPGASCHWRRFAFASDALTTVTSGRVDALARAHLVLRRQKDGLDFRASQDVEVTVSDRTNMTLEVTRDAREPQTSTRITPNVLVAINPLELGIEVVKVVEYALEDANCLLDGEMYCVADEAQLVRMPVALVSLDYLHGVFGSPDYFARYSEAAVQPSIEAPPFRQNAIHVYEWEIERRRLIWGGPAASEWERARYADWRQRFERNFLEGLTGDAARFPHVFTPGTAKVLNLFFNCCELGLQLATRYRIANSFTAP
jgi:hypothetical protein